MTPANNAKPYVKLAATLASLGIGIYFIEQFGLREITKYFKLHMNEFVLSILVIAPFALIISGALVFMIGKMRRL
ncbi:hypothetical protein [Devosia sp. CN2-171]|uniref:hypothetical protein n=1 Tax=Devosia sp. CN2-171 TaxID=3400909 RepID=UPI003BF8C8FA